MNSSTQSSVVRLPKSVVASLFRRCGTLGEPGVEAVREAGDRVGADLLETVAPSPDTLPATEFWSGLDGALREAGLGSVSFRPASRGTGAISWRASAEAPERGAATPSCHFAAGLLAGVLSGAAQRRVHVTEVRCGGGQPCWFIFGSADAIQDAGVGRGSVGAQR